MAKKKAGAGGSGAAKNKSKPPKGKLPTFLNNAPSPSHSRESSPPPAQPVEESENTQPEIAGNKPPEVTENKPTETTDTKPIDSTKDLNTKSIDSTKKSNAKPIESFENTPPQVISTPAPNITETKPPKITENKPPKLTSPTPPKPANPSKPTPALQALSQKWDQKSQELTTAINLLITTPNREQKDAIKNQLEILAKEFIAIREGLTEAEESNHVGDIIPIRVSMIQRLKEARKVLEEFFAKDREGGKGVEVEGKCVVEVEMATAVEEKIAIEAEKIVLGEEKSAVEKVEDVVEKEATGLMKNIAAFDEKEAAVKKETARLERERAALEAEKAAVTEEKIAVETEQIAIKEEKIAVEAEKVTIGKETANPQKKEDTRTKNTSTLEKESADTKNQALDLNEETEHEGPITGHFRISDFLAVPAAGHFLYACHFALLPTFLALSDGKPLWMRMCIWMIWALPNFFWDFTKFIRILTGAVAYFLLCFYYIYG
ncbi:hypothetical protein TWF506_003967 [Arthrobotrys conoides]|uniref:Uncharacterized protein n=1 Tax=Arthrobotrys conoides TaxID=74498 RepID=A0AAN8P4J6_9PEZI